MTFKEMQTELRKQKPHHPDPKAWEGISLVNSAAEAQAWLDRLADVTPQPNRKHHPPLLFLWISTLTTRNAHAHG